MHYLQQNGISPGIIPTKHHTTQQSKVPVPISGVTWVCDSFWQCGHLTKIGSYGSYSLFLAGSFYSLVPCSFCLSGALSSAGCSILAYSGLAAESAWSFLSAIFEKNCFIKCNKFFLFFLVFFIFFFFSFVF